MAESTTTSISIRLQARSEECDATIKPLAAILLVALGFALAACRGAEEPQITHWYGTGGSYTTGVYEDPAHYWSPGPD